MTSLALVALLWLSNYPAKAASPVMHQFLKRSSRLLERPIKARTLFNNTYRIQRQSDDFSVIFRRKVDIASHDGTILKANLFIPDQNDQISKGLIVFINSWALDKHQYLVQAYKFALKGYTVLSYGTRGFGGSEGYVEVASKNDIQDLVHVIDWAQDRYSFQTEKVASIGVSYGGVISLLTAAIEPRIKTVISMSAGTDVFKALYGAQSPRKIWGSLLLLTGNIFGRLDPVVGSNFKDLMSFRNIGHIAQWCKERSAMSMLHLLNEQKPAIYMSHNWHDYLFPSQTVIDFYRAYEGPKQLDLNTGLHATNEFFGLLEKDHYLWKQAEIWVEKWLGGKHNKDWNRPELSMEVKNTKKREWFGSNFSKLDHREKLVLTSEHNMFFNSIRRNHMSQTQVPIRIFAEKDSGASTGIPLISEVLDKHADIPVTKKMNQISSKYGSFFSTQKLEHAVKIRGSIKLTFKTTSSDRKSQLLAYLYDVDENNVGTLISHGVATRFNLQGIEKQQIGLLPAAYDVDKNHKLVLVIDNHDSLYKSPLSKETNWIDLLFDEDQPPVLSINTN